MRAVFTWALLLVLAITISCGGGSSSQNHGMAQIRVLQASVDIGNVDVVVNGKQIATNLGWGAEFPLPTTTYTTIQAGNLRFEEFPTATTSTPSLSTQYSISPNTYYTILPMGEKSTGSLASIIFPDDHVPPPPGGFRVRLVNAASTVGTMDIYLTSSRNDPVPASPTFPAFGYKSVSSYMSFTGTTMNICANPAGVIPVNLVFCLISVQYQLLLPPTSSSTLLFMDPYIPPNPPPGSFTTPVVFRSLPY